MRGPVESINEPAPPSLHLDEFGEELQKNLGMPQGKVLAFRAAVELKWNTCTTCGPLMLQSQQEMAEVFEQAGLADNEVATIKMCLGTVANPHKFPPSSPQPADDSPPKLEKKGKKGGSTKEVSETLQTRRPTLAPEHYFPPSQFDPHRLGNVTRNEYELRQLIVQEVCVLPDTSRACHTSPPLGPHSHTP